MTRACRYGGGGADAYLALIADQLKPRIDRDYRTLADRGHTAIMGSSLGGLVSVYAGVTRPDVFGLVGALSPSTWWDGTWILPRVATERTDPARVYVDSGDAGDSQDDQANTATLAQTYRTRGATSTTPSSTAPSTTNFIGASACRAPSPSCSARADRRCPLSGIWPDLGRPPTSLKLLRDLLVPIRYLFRGVSRRFTAPRKSRDRSTDQIAVGTR